MTLKPVLSSRQRPNKANSTSYPQWTTSENAVTLWGCGLLDCHLWIG